MKFEITPEQMGYPASWQSCIPEGWEVDGVGFPSKYPHDFFLIAISHPYADLPFVQKGCDFSDRGKNTFRIRLRKINPCLKYYGHERIEDVPIPEGFVRVGDLQKEKPEGATYFLDGDLRQKNVETPRSVRPTIWLRELTPIEKDYGIGATPESVWAKACPNPEDYGKPQYGPQPEGHYGWVLLSPNTKGFEDAYCADMRPYIWAPKLTDEQKAIAASYPGRYSVAEVVSATKGDVPEGSTFVWQKVRAGDWYATKARMTSSWDIATTHAVVVGQYRVVAIPPAAPKKVTRKRVIFEQSEDKPRFLNEGELGMEPEHDPLFCGIVQSSIGYWVPCTRREETFEVEIEETAGCC